MAAKRIAQSSINWAAIAERVPVEQKSNYLAFKTKHDQYIRKVMAFPEQPPKIDWAFYKSKIPLPAMVDEFQKKYESFKIPLPEDNVTATIAAEEKEAASYIQKFKQESLARIEKHKAELQKFDGRIPLVEMTMEDFAYHYPEEALDAINRPTFWPHRPEDQPGPDDVMFPTDKDVQHH